MLDRRVIRCVTVLAAMIGRLGTGVIANSALAGDDAEASQVVGGSQATGNAVQPKSQGRFVIQAETVDPQGKPLSGVELALAVYDASGTGRTEPRIERAISDGQGRGRFDVAPKRPGERPLYAYVRAYDPGRALASAEILLSEITAPPPAVRLVLDEPVKRTITVMGPDDRPIADVRLLPHRLRRLSRPGTESLADSIPREWVGRLTITTDTSGVATIPYLARALDVMTARVSGPQIALQTLVIPAGPGDGPDGRILRLGRSGRLVGVVRSEDGQPLVDVLVEVWVRAAGVMPDGVGVARARRRLTPTEIVKFDSDSPRTASARHIPDTCCPFARIDLSRLDPPRGLRALCLGLGHARRRAHSGSLHRPEGPPETDRYCSRSPESAGGRGTGVRAIRRPSDDN